MKRLARIILIAAAVLVLLVAGSIAALLAFLDDDDYRRLVAYLVERETGRAMIVDGRFALYPSLRPSLVMSKVRIPNPSWASTPDLAQIEHLELQIALRPLLSGILVVERLILNDARFALERSADGTANWTLGDGGDGLGLVPVFGAVRLRNVDWSYRDDARGEGTAVALAHLTLAETGAAAQLDVQGAWEGEAITAQGTFGTLAEALRPTRPFPVDWSASLPGLDLSARGTIAEPAAGRGLDLRLVAKSDDVRPLLERLDSEAPLAGPLQGEATLGGDFDAVKIADLRLSVGSDQAPMLKTSGSIATVSPGGAPMLDGIALQMQGTASASDLSAWLGRPLAALGPVQGQLTLGGSSEALSISQMKLHAGAENRVSISATGGIEKLGLAPAFSMAGADVQLAAEGQDLAALGTLIGLSLPAGAFSYSGRLSGDPEKWSFNGGGRLGDTAITQTFTGTVATTPPRLTGELSLALAGLKLTGRGTVADPARGQGLELHVSGHADDVAPLLAMVGHTVPPGRLAVEATIGGDLAALRVSDLRLSLAPAASLAISPDLQAKGQIASVTPNGAALLNGIALEIQGTTSTAVLSGWLGRPLPDLGPLGGRFMLGGTSRALSITQMKLEAGTAGRLTIDATGGVKQIRLSPQLAVRGADLRLDAKAPDPAIIGAMLDVSVPTVGALSYTGQLSGDLDAWKLAGKVHVGRTVIMESLAGSLQRARPRISGKLSIPVLHLADFGVAAEREPHADGGSGIEVVASGLASSLASLRALDPLDLALNVEIGQVEGTELAIGRGKVDLTLEDGVARIDPATFDFVAGTALVHLTADARAKPPQIDLSLHADDVQLGELLLAMGGTSPITGELALILKLRSRGDAKPQLLSSLGGEAHFAIQRGDVDLSVNLATADLVTWLLAGAQQGTGLLRRRTGSGRTRLDCLAGRFDIEQGIATAQALLMTTPLTLSTATGTLNLVDQTLDLQVRLRPRRSGALGSATSYRIFGPMADPSVNISTTRFAARALEGLIMSPLDALGSLLLPLVADGGRDPTNPCLQ